MRVNDSVSDLGKYVWDYVQENCSMTVDPTRKECSGIAKAVLAGLNIELVIKGEHPIHGDLFVTEEPTYRNWCVGIPDIVRFDENYHKVKRTDDGEIYVVTEGGTWLDVLRIIERNGNPVAYLG